MAVMNMMLYYIISEGYVAEEFVNDRTEGFEEFKKQVLATDLNGMAE